MIQGSNKFQMVFRLLIWSNSLFANFGKFMFALILN